MFHIDAHVHVWSDDDVRYPVDPAAAGTRLVRSFTPEQILALANPSGVDRVVLIQMNFYGCDNRRMLDAIRDRPGTFRGVAIVDPLAHNLSDTLRQLHAAGVRGLRIHPGQASPEPANWLEAYDALFTHAGALGLAVCPLIGPDAISPLSRMCERFPQTTVVVDHLARIGMAGPPREDEVAALCRLAQHPRARVKASAFYALGAKRPPHDDLIPLIRRVLDAFGPRRVMWASDCPFQTLKETYEDSIGLVRDRLGLAAQERDWVLGKSAETVFFG